MQKLSSVTWKKVCSYSSIMGLLCSLAIFLTIKIIVNTTSHSREKRTSILLLTKAAELASSQGSLPPATALPTLEHAYHMGEKSTHPYASFLSACFYLHNEPLRGAYYASLAYQNSLGSCLPNPIQTLLKEISEIQAAQQYEKALNKSLELLQISSVSPNYSTLQFLTLLRIIELKEILNQDTTKDFEKLKGLPLFQEFEQFYRDGEWTLTRRFSKQCQKALKTIP
ncbi:hypothetical protein [Chlamydia sp. 17-3921]|uniref:hypothetical protein n=1 Tax=Chlamydia sp. 17-3921 TaxID=2675798 RepID=UPI00191805E1|nr:hypothetical protein [Chlamydia sp. 17-3921]